jgi:hypothetical protein
MFLLSNVNIDVLRVDLPIWLNSLGPRLIIKVVVTVESLVTFDCLLKLELNLGKVRTEFKRNFVYKF